jgi:hypothetical protein
LKPQFTYAGFKLCFVYQVALLNQGCYLEEDAREMGSKMQGWAVLVGIIKNRVEIAYDFSA